MAFPSLLALLDDIATILDDVAVLSKVAAKKTAGVVGDDLALNAHQVAGVRPERELPVVWAVAKGSALNKVILVPLALLISSFAEWAITPLLMIGGIYLCFEGVEKLAQKLLHSREEKREHHRELLEAVADPTVDLVAVEKQKVKGAIRTDFILSAEIVVITLGTLDAATFAQRVAVLTVVAVAMTIGVYGLVAGIVKLDDLGLRLVESARAVWRGLGKAILRAAPVLLKLLSVAGTAAMFLVGGGIITHGFEVLGSWSHHAAEHVETWGSVGVVASVILPLLFDAVVGIFAGAIAVVLFTLVKKLVPARKKAS